jgi:hypothetical protein
MQTNKLAGITVRFEALHSTAGTSLYTADEQTTAELGKQGGWCGRVDGAVA